MTKPYTLIEEGPIDEYSKETGKLKWRSWSFAIRCGYFTMAGGVYLESPTGSQTSALTLNETRALWQRMTDAANQEDTPDA